MDEYDIYFDNVEAEAWRQSLVAEIHDVEHLLSQVHKECQEQVQDKDPIMSGIVEAGDKMESLWDKMIGNFKTCSDKVGDIITEFINASRNAVDDLTNQVANKIGQ